jgi:MFS superfamily sulfate permease-like transporter
LVLGVESVPDGLAAGLLAGVSPLSGLYAYLFGMIGGPFFTSSAFMAVQATGVTDLINPENIYSGDERVAATLKRAYADAMTWIERNHLADGTDQR